MNQGMGHVIAMPTLDMSIQRSVYCSLMCFTCIFGTLGSVYLHVPQTYFKGFEQESVLLSVSYSFSEPFTFLQIKWEFISETEVILMHTFRKVTSANGSSEIFNKSFISKKYQNRVSLSPENGSLWMDQLRLKDSGNYQIIIKDSQSSATNVLNLTVLSCCHAANMTEERNITFTKNMDCESSFISSVGALFLLMRVTAIILSFLLLLAVHLILQHTHLK
ncbi:uncharacterized protein LOC122794665 isoform X2 [Protopterus annectens]|uniref:uncharacterized protein LOC122794665 isoform X2 n=1 Tax=Protopterus annectens TaxID=7888 RepID=UPI001CF98EC9|nr:uncharacterized protein LOC122794665 isoform X2 [Protopterus annectens]